MEQPKTDILKTERRIKLDGGLDTRSGPYGAPDRVSDILNLHFDETGSLTKRMGASQVLRPTLQHLLPAPTVAQTTGGSIADNTYFVAYTLLSHADSGEHGPSSEGSVTVAAGGGTAALFVTIKGNNGGDAIGQGSDGLDDPCNGGFQRPAAISGADPSVIKVYVGTVSGTLKLQVITAYVLNSSGWRLTISAYNAGAAAAPALTYRILPGRTVAWLAEILVAVAWFADRVIALVGPTVVGPEFFAATFDKPGNLVYFSRFPSQVKIVSLLRILVAFDGFGRPKRLNWSGVVSTSNWCLLGATVPTAAPTTALSAIGITGTYKYVYTYIYSYTAGDATVQTAESNASPASASVSPINQTVTVTCGSTSESSYSTMRLYRTQNGGSVYYLVTDGTNPIAPSGFVFTDAQADANLDLSTSPPDHSPNTPNTVPLPRLYHPVEFVGRLFAFVVQWRFASNPSNLISLFTGTTTVWYTKSLRPDAWPFSLYCGSGKVTGAITKNGRIYVFKEDSIGMISGSGITDTDFSFATLYARAGAMENSIIEVGELIFFWDTSTGPKVLAGSSVADIGDDAVHEDWLAGQASGIVIRDVAYDPNEHLVKWVATTFSCQPDLYTNSPTVHKQYCFFLITKTWTIFTGASTSGRVDRLIQSETLVPSPTWAMVEKPRYRPYWVDLFGRFCLENQNEYDLDPTDTNTHAPIVYRAQLNILFGDQPEMVKLFRYLFVHFILGGSASAFDANDVLTVAGTYLSQIQSGFQTTLPTVVTIKSFNGTASTYLDQVRRCDIQTALAGNRNTERGLLIRLSGSAINKTVIKALMALKYRDVSDVRSGQ